MSQPINLFQHQQQSQRTSQVKHLTGHVAYWQKLTKTIQPLLPQPEQWQVACYQHGILTVTGENQAMVSQLAYLQKHYIEQLSSLNDFKDLHKINVRIRNPIQNVQSTKTIQLLPAETQQMLQDTAQLIKDPKLSQALMRLASVKK